MRCIKKQNSKILPRWTPPECFPWAPLWLSLDKTCFSVFGVRDDNARCKVELRPGNVILKQVSCCNYLGIIIDNNLTWSEHINYIYNKILKFTSIFIRYATFCLLKF